MTSLARLANRVAACAIAIVLAFAALGSHEGHAAPKATKVIDALHGDAKDAFNRARVLLSKGDYAAARGEYERAFELSNEPRVLYNVAVCSKEQGKYAAAIRVLQRSTELAKDAPTEYLERVADTIDTLLVLVATVTIEGVEPAMVVEVDGEPVPVSVAGKLLVDAGTRRIVVRQPGFAPQSFTRDFPARERYTFTVTLAPLPGKVRIVASGIRDASVVLDGREVGLAPLTLSLSPGAHEVVVRAPSFRDMRRMVEVTSEQEMLVDVPLERDTRVARLRIAAGARDVISIDGRSVGKGSFDGSISAGEHRLVIYRPDAQPETIEVALRENEVRDMRVTIPEKKGGSLPAWVWVLGGAVLVGGASTAIYFAARPTDFEGSSPGTLSPRVIPAAFIRGGQ